MSFDSIINQKKAKSILLGQLSSGKIPHAYLFLGQDGIGRKKTALELAKTLDCQTNSGRKALQEPCDHCIACGKIDRLIHPDVQLINYEWQANLRGEEVEKQRSIKIDTIRALQYEVNLKPVEARWKIFIIDPAEEITDDAANCLLKTLEEPPEWTVIILLAKHKENLPATIVSRTQMVPFQPLSEADVSNYLAANSKISKIQADAVAKLSEGSISCALRLLDDRKTVQSAFWTSTKRGRMSAAAILGESDKNTKNSREFLQELLAEVKSDFRRDPEAYQPVIQEIIDSQKLIDSNVNPKFVLDALLLKINSVVDRRPGNSQR